MRRLWLIIRVLLVVAVFAGAYEATRYWQAQQLTHKLENAIALPIQNGRAVAVRAAASSLKGVANPNVYAYLKQADLQRAVNEALSHRAATGGAADKVTLSEATLLCRPEGLGMTLPFTAANGRFTLTGVAELETAVQANGGYLDFYPLAGKVQLVKLQFSRFTFDGNATVTRLASEALTFALRTAAERISSISVPLTLGASRGLDIAGAFPGVSLEGAVPLRVRLGADKVAVVVAEGGLHILGRLATTSDDEFASIVATLRAVKDKVQAEPTTASACTQCDLVSQGLSRFRECVRARSVCEARRTLHTPTPDLRVSAQQALVLSELQHSDNPQDRELFGFFKPFLTPFGTVDEKIADDLSDQAYARAAREVVAGLLARRSEVDEPAAVNGDATHVAIQKAFIKEAISAIARPLLVRQLRASLADRPNQSISQDIVTGPAPKLECERNSRRCESNFTFRPEPDRPCASDCTTNDLKCFLGVCTNVPGVNLDCQGKKLDCERIKVQEKAQYQVERGAAFLKWKVEHDICEARKSVERVGCELNQGWLNDWQNTKLGHLDGVVSFTHPQGEYRLTGMQIPDDLSTASLSGTLSGGVHVSTTFVYKPEDSIKGRLVCALNWGGELQADVGLRPQPVSLAVTLNEEASNATGVLVFQTQQQDLNVSMVPPPGIALLKDTPQAAVACPFVGAAGAVVAGTPGVNILAAVKIATTDTFTVTIKAREFRVDPAAIVLPWADRKVNLRLTKRTIVATLN